jgi:hypothetical protein
VRGFLDVNEVDAPKGCSAPKLKSLAYFSFASFLKATEHLELRYWQRSDNMHEGGRFVLGTWLSASDVRHVKICAAVCKQDAPWDSEVKDALYKLLRPTISPHLNVRSRGGTAPQRSADQSIQMLILELASHGTDAPAIIMKRLLIVWALEAFGKVMALSGMEDEGVLAAAFQELDLAES